jgi:hypothetical protein
MKNALWYIGYFLLLALQASIFVAILLVAVLPIIMALTRHGFWWFGLWLLEPMLLIIWALLDNVIEAM